jgi:hypothetical protein
MLEKLMLNTALANNHELVMPIIVTGTFQHPQVAPDMHGNVKHMTRHHVCSASALPWTAFGKRRSANNQLPKPIAPTPWK